MSGRSCRLCRATVVLICTFMPRARAVSQASRVQRNTPGTPRKSSWSSAVEPSRLSERPVAPAACTARSRSSVSVGVPEGDTATRTPISLP